jgi:hypothetical protein
VEEKGVDLVLSLNYPMNVSDNAVRTEEEYIVAKQAFHSIATSLRIVDLNLFA